jgi:hypothetical protein
MRPVASGVNEKFSTAILLVVVSRQASVWMSGSVFRLTSLARVASRRCLLRCSRLHPSDQCQQQHQKLHQFLLRTYRFQINRFSFIKLFVQAVGAGSSRWEATTLERCQQICSMFSQRSFRPGLTSTRSTIASQAVSRSPIPEPSVPSIGTLALAFTHNVFPITNSSEVDLTSCDSTKSE